jgi:hypothetical protein
MIRKYVLSMQKVYRQAVQDFRFYTCPNAMLIAEVSRSPQTHTCSRGLSQQP